MQLKYVPPQLVYITEKEQLLCYDFTEFI